MPPRSDTPQGRLELTWANKKRRLIAHDDGTYEWVPQNDYRAREVRLLREAGTIGQAPSATSGDLANIVVRGDALHALTALTMTPAYAEHLLGRVKLIYIDPPYNTGEMFEHYDDNLEHSVWLTAIRDQLALFRTLLAPDGAIYIQIDDTEFGNLMALMREIFGDSNFINVITVQRSGASGHKAINPGVVNVADYIIGFARDKASWTPKPLYWPRGRDSAYNRVILNPDEHFSEWTLGSLSKAFQAEHGVKSQKDLEAKLGRKYESALDAYVIKNAHSVVRLAAPGDVGKDVRAVVDKSKAEPGVVHLAARARHPDLYYLDGQQILFYADKVREIDGIQTTAERVTNIWTDLNFQGIAGEGGVKFPKGKKPEALLRRLLEHCTEPGDLVLDSFGGSGTTAAVAHKMGRRWVIVEQSVENLREKIVPRLERVVAGTDTTGVSKPMGWKGGGGFRVLDVGPSMFEDDDGVVVLAEWATEHALAEAVAAQLGFRYEPDGSFCGRKGRTRLAVLDGHLSKDTARMLLGALAERENLAVVAVGLDPEADKLLRKERPGSRARVAPRDLLLTYAQPATWQVAETTLITPEMEEQLEELGQLDLLAEGGDA